jgi:uncharacterized membrane protein SpoIIM required for sporulation
MRSTYTPKVDIDQYIARYRPEWERLETLAARGTRGLGRLSGPELDEVLQRYLRVSAHLSETRTLFGDRNLDAYLTSVVASAHAAVYGARPRTAAGVFHLFGRRYRAAIRRTGPFILVAAVVMAIGIVATLLWITHSPEAQAGVIPPQARQAIQRAGGGRVDFGASSGTVSSWIFLNNVRVAFLAFVAGIGACILTLLLLVQNSFTVGALGAGFHLAGKAGTFWALILPHGVLELTAIAVAAGAGLRMGWSLIDPGDRARSRALAEEASDAVTVVVGVVPAFLIAAAIEGFVTGTSVMPRAAQVALGVAAGVGYLIFLFGLPSAEAGTAAVAAGATGAAGAPGATGGAGVAGAAGMAGMAVAEEASGPAARGAPLP